MDTKLLNNKKNIMQNEVLQGLIQYPKTLPCKYFYDDKGSRLFEQICKLDEYYLTRTEIEIMKENSAEMADIIGEKCLIIELGCGNSDKIQILLNHLNNPAAYVAIDISKNALMEFVTSLHNKNPKLKIFPIFADYTQEIKFPDIDYSYSKRIVYYPGSNIGNFGRKEIHKILKIIHKLCGQDGSLLIGIDLKKDKSTLERAYNDKKGITAKFNLNILDNINHKLNSNFNIDNFQHKAIYNEIEGQIEMYLISKINQEVKIGDQNFIFDKKEQVLTEVSCKFTIKEFKNLVKDFFEVKNVWTDIKNEFAVIYLDAK